MHGAVYIDNYLIIGILLNFGLPISGCCYYRRTYVQLSPIVVVCQVVVIYLKSAYFNEGNPAVVILSAPQNKRTHLRIDKLKRPE